MWNFILGVRRLRKNLGKNYFLTVFAKKGPRQKWTIYKHVSVVINSTSTAYISDEILTWQDSGNTALCLKKYHKN